MTEYIDLTMNWENATQGVQFTCVKAGAADNGCDIATADSDDIIGILQNKPKLNQAAQVRVYGPSKLMASAAIARKAYITATTLGKGVTCTTTSSHAVAIAIFEAATADTQLFKVWALGPGFKFVT